MARPAMRFLIVLPDDSASLMQSILLSSQLASKSLRFLIQRCSGLLLMLVIAACTRA